MPRRMTKAAAMTAPAKNSRGTLDLKDLARRVTLAEGGAQSLSVAQVAEVIGLTLDLLVQAEPADVAALLAERRESRHE